MSVDALMPDLWPHRRQGLPLSRSHDHRQWATSFWPTLFSRCVMSPVSGHERWSLTGASDVQGTGVVCSSALRQWGTSPSPRFLVCSAHFPQGSAGMREDSQLHFFVSSPSCFHVLRRFNEVFVITVVHFPSFEVWVLFGLPIFLLVLIFATIWERNMSSLPPRVLALH